MIKIVNTFSRYIVALVFIFSGFVKLIDPYGTAYKIGDYAESIHLVLPLWISLTVSVLLSVAEFTLGLSAFFKIIYEKVSKIIFGFVSVFTALTLWIAIANPVQDCGCFGDALVISNWSTFLKNIVLLLLSVEMLRNRNYLRSRVCEINQQILLGIFLTFSVVVAMNSIHHLPFLDFRPYKVGTYIPEQMKVPDGMPKDVYETTFIYEKEGVQEAFNEDNYPWQDTTWTYVDSKNVLVEKGYEPPVHDFVIEHPEWGDITEEVLRDENYSLLLVSPNLRKASLKHKDRIEALAKMADNLGYRFLVLTASLGDEVQEFTSNFETPMHVCNMDEITLKTIVRAYPGLVVMKGGVILDKYHHKDLPRWDEKTNIMSDILSHREKRKNRIIVLLLALLLGGVGFKLTQHKDYSK